MAKSFDALAKRVMTANGRTRAAERARQLLAGLVLSELRKLAGKSQTQLARALGIRQPSLSKLENQDDMQISTLTRIVEALGGQLQIIARFDGREVRLRQFKTGKKRRRSARRARELPDIQAA